MRRPQYHQQTPTVTAPTLPHDDCGFSSISGVSSTFSPAASFSARPHEQFAHALREVEQSPPSAATSSQKEEKNCSHSRRTKGPQKDRQHAGRDSDTGVHSPCTVGAHKTVCVQSMSPCGKLQPAQQAKPAAVVAQPHLQVLPLASACPPQSAAHPHPQSPRPRHCLKSSKLRLQLGQGQELLLLRGA